MNTEERIKDIFKTGGFNPEEIEHVKDNIFKSIEYYIIIHLTNAELYYQSAEEEEINKSAEEIRDTEKGRVYFFN